jgi:hypothetical protein
MLLNLVTHQLYAIGRNAYHVHKHGAYVTITLQRCIVMESWTPNEEKSIHANTTPVSKVVTNPNFVRACSWMVVVLVVKGHFTHEPRAVTMRL